MSEITLPKKIVKAAVKSPKRIVLYGPPKIGKTTMLSQLEGCLILDLEDGSNFLDALKINVHNLEELSEIGRQIHGEGKPYKYIAIDTVTALESWCEADGKRMYQASPQGKNFDPNNLGTSVLTLPNGAGYRWLRDSYELWMNRLYSLADHVIVIGHLKDKFLEKKGKEVSAKDIDLTGKLKSITCAHADAIGYIYREDGKTMVTFGSGEEIAVGSRCEHLIGFQGELKWNKIFID